jgi:hypothetical protein
MIEERLKKLWDDTKKSIEEGTLDQHLPDRLKFFSEEVLPPLAVKAFFAGVGKLDQEAANTVLAELGKTCGDFALAGMRLRGLETPVTDIDTFLEAHESGEKAASGGQAEISREGNTATLVIKGGCVCPLVKTLQIEPTPNHCLCTYNHLKHLYETGLGRPVAVELIETYLRGDSSCIIRMSWQE